MELNIAGINLRLIHEIPLAVTNRFAPFVGARGDVTYTAEFCEVNSLPALLPAVYEGVCWRLHPDGGAGYLRTFFDAPYDSEPYALASYHWNEKKIHIHYLPKGRENVARLENCFFKLAWETLMLHERRMVLHAACVDTTLGGLLFSGPSGIGKSTQARHWCACFGGLLINEDRPILQQTDSGWYAWGAPYAGSSRVFVNEKCPVRGLFVLKQGPSCRLRQLRGREAFSAIYRQLTVDQYDTFAVETACDLARALIQEVPVMEFTCTAGPEAAQFLEKESKQWNVYL